MTSHTGAVVIFGATGNVGSSLIRRLLTAQPDRAIVGVARRVPEPGDWPEADGRVRFVARDIGVDRLDDVLSGAESVVHLAWQLQPSHDRDRLWRTNVAGSRRLFEAAADAGVRHLIYASSVGVYAPGPKLAKVDESWSRDGVLTSTYSRHKAEVERYLDRFEPLHPEMRVVRMRPGLIFKREAAASIHRLFIGRIPRPLLPRLPVMPDLDGAVVQVVHSDDAARAYALALDSDVDGALNICADRPVDVAELARILDARLVSFPVPTLRAGWQAGWRMRVAAAEPGWLDLALRAPLMTSARARTVLDWTATVTPEAAIRELLAGFAERSDGPTPALANGSSARPAS